MLFELQATEDKDAELMGLVDEEKERLAGHLAWEATKRPSEVQVLMQSKHAQACSTNDQQV